MAEEDEEVNGWDMWKEVYLVGTEWDQYSSVFDVEWDFSHMKHELEEGVLHRSDGRSVFIFGATEPQLLKYKANPEKNLPERDIITHIPVMIAIVSSMDPPRRVGIKSVQMEQENIVDMRSLKMDWFPYVIEPLVRGKRKAQAPIFLLKCTQRRTALPNLKDEQKKRFEYCNPYILLPKDMGDDDVNTIVNVEVELDGRVQWFEFDWELDTLDDFVDDLIKSRELTDSEENKEKIRIGVQKEVKAAKQRVKEARAEKRRRVAAIPQEEKDALESMEVFKFYPTNDEPDLGGFKSTFVNRYYRHASRVF